MRHRIRFFIAFALSCAALFSQQPSQRRAKIPTRSASSGTPNDAAPGKCTLQAKVDFAAQIEISGDIASISALQGGEATIPVFECNAEIPRNAADLRIMGADRQTKLVGRQRIGGPLVIEIENQSGGSKEHKFEIAWGGVPKDSSSAGASNSTGVASPPASGVVPGSSSGQVALPMSRNAAEQATVRACQDAVAVDAHTRFPGQPAIVRNSRIVSREIPEEESVLIQLDIRLGPNQFDRYEFRCALDYSPAQIRSIDFKQTAKAN